MIEITLPILFNTEGSEELSKLGLDVPDSEYEERPMTFYVITAIHEHRQDGKSWTRVFTPGDSFICPLSITEVATSIRMNNLSLK